MWSPLGGGGGAARRSLQRVQRLSSRPTALAVPDGGGTFSRSNIVPAPLLHLLLGPARAERSCFLFFVCAWRRRWCAHCTARTAARRQTRAELTVFSSRFFGLPLQVLKKEWASRGERAAAAARRRSSPPTQRRTPTHTHTQRRAAYETAPPRRPRYEEAQLVSIFKVLAVFLKATMVVVASERRSAHKTGAGLQVVFLFNTHLETFPHSG